jgi:hypothetical protein
MKINELVVSSNKLFPTLVTSGFRPDVDCKATSWTTLEKLLKRKVMGTRMINNQFLSKQISVIKSALTANN